MINITEMSARCKLDPTLIETIKGVGSVRFKAGRVRYYNDRGIEITKKTLIDSLPAVIEDKHVEEQRPVPSITVTEDGGFLARLASDVFGLPHPDTIRRAETAKQARIRRLNRRIERLAADPIRVGQLRANLAILVPMQ